MNNNLSGFSLIGMQSAAPSSAGCVSRIAFYEGTFKLTTLKNPKSGAVSQTRQPQEPDAWLAGKLTTLPQLVASFCVGKVVDP
jgi:hypothetical protein